MLQSRGVRISMDGRGRWVDNVFVEGLWRSVKYQEVCLHAYGSIAEANRRIGTYFDFYNRVRPHQGLDRLTPDAACPRPGTLSFVRGASSTGCLQRSIRF